MTPEIALQTALRLRLVGFAPLAALVPASSILDRNQRPAPDPSVIIGEGLSVDDGDSIARNRLRIVTDLHCWKREPSLAGVKQIAGAIRSAVKFGLLALEDGFHCVDARVASVRTLRDPDGETSHAVVTVEAIVEELS
jgi:hypothetical protein